MSWLVPFDVFEEEGRPRWVEEQLKQPTWHMPRSGGKEMGLFNLLKPAVTLKELGQGPVF